MPLQRIDDQQQQDRGARCAILRGRGIPVHGCRLKHIVAEQTLDIQVLKAVLQESGKPRPASAIRRLARGCTRRRAADEGANLKRRLWPPRLSRSR